MKKVETDFKSNGEALDSCSGDTPILLLFLRLPFLPSPFFLAWPPARVTRAVVCAAAIMDGEGTRQG